MAAACERGAESAHASSERARTIRALEPLTDSPRKPFVRHLLPSGRPARITFGENQRPHEVSMLVYAADGPRDAVEIAVAGNAVAGRLVELHRDADGEAGIALEAQPVPLVERAE